jgi:hypothetical protein
MQIGEITMSNLVVLCDDGAMLQYSPRQTPPWTRFPSVPGVEVDLQEVNPHSVIPGVTVLGDAGEEPA